MKAFSGMHGYVSQFSLPATLIDMVYLRASLIAGCTYCIDMHSRDLLKGGLATEKLVLVSAWREAGEPFDAWERAALAWAEAATRVAQTGVPDETYQAPASVLGTKEMADLTIAIGLMDAYNRMVISFRMPLQAARH